MEQLSLQMLQEDVALFTLEQQSELQQAWEQPELRRGTQLDLPKEKQLEHQLLLPQLRMGEGELLVPLTLEEGEPLGGEQLELQLQLQTEKQPEPPTEEQLELLEEKKPELQKKKQLQP